MVPGWKMIICFVANEVISDSGERPTTQDIFLDVCERVRASHRVAPTYTEIDTFLNTYYRLLDSTYYCTIDMEEIDGCNKYCYTCGKPINTQFCDFCGSGVQSHRPTMDTVGWI